ncbi:UTP--glucose-1-phosphate uridylyltransferase [Amylibacter sp.]|nr:UTP--glucose-1-phosphate uridylyltransferase [Amylibacter sp.]
MTHIKPITKAVIPVAGLGTRMLPATKAIPKELLPVYDRPLIEHVIKEAISVGITEIILVTRSGKEAIENHFDAHYELEHRLVKKGKKKILENVVKIIPDYVKITSVRQADALGLGHAILCAKHLLNNEPFAVLLPDVLVLDKKNKKNYHSFNQLVKAWSKTGVGQVMVERVDLNSIENYGIVDFGKNDIEKFISIPLVDLVEKPSIQDTPSNFALLGRYILPSNVLEYLEYTKVGVGDEIQLTDALQKLLNINGLNGLETDADIYDCGNKIGYLGANLAVGMRDQKTNVMIKALLKKLLSV